LIVILDTNVWISAVHFVNPLGSAARALEKAKSQDIFATCLEIEAEIFRILTEKFSWPPDRAKATLTKFLGNAIRVQITGTLKACRDPNDDMFLECAALAKADLLVAGDKDLLILGSYLGTRIVTPAEYVDAPPAPRA
jgi:putative PIN family toxin of toxin-antitoxin system